MWGWFWRRVWGSTREGRKFRQRGPPFSWKCRRKNMHFGRIRTQKGSQMDSRRSIRDVSPEGEVVTWGWRHRIVGCTGGPLGTVFITEHRTPASHWYWTGRTLGTRGAMITSLADMVTTNRLTTWDAIPNKTAQTQITHTNPATQKSPHQHLTITNKNKPWPVLNIKLLSSVSSFCGTPRPTMPLVPLPLKCLYNTHSSPRLHYPKYPWYPCQFQCPCTRSTKGRML